MKRRTLTMAFYKNSKTLFGRGIRCKQRYLDDSPYWIYSHVEIVDEQGFFYSASEVDGGVRKKKIEDEKGNWDYLKIEVSEAEYWRVMWFIRSKLGLRYDRAGIFFAQMLGTMWFLRPDKYFCSEFCTEALQQIGMIIGRAGYSVTPAKLYELLLESK